MNFGYIILDYFIQVIENGGSKEEALTMANVKLNKFEDKLENDERVFVEDIINRLSQI